MLSACRDARVPLTRRRTERPRIDSAASKFPFDPSSCNRLGFDRTPAFASALHRRKMLRQPIEALAPAAAMAIARFVRGKPGLLQRELGAAAQVLKPHH